MADGAVVMNKGLLSIFKESSYSPVDEIIEGLEDVEVFNFTVDIILRDDDFESWSRL